MRRGGMGGEGGGGICHKSSIAGGMLSAGLQHFEFNKLIMSSIRGMPFHWNGTPHLTEQLLWIFSARSEGCEDVVLIRWSSYICAHMHTRHPPSLHCVHWKMAGGWGHPKCASNYSSWKYYCLCKVQLSDNISLPIIHQCVVWGRVE